MNAAAKDSQRLWRMKHGLKGAWLDYRLYVSSKIEKVYIKGQREFVRRLVKRVRTQIEKEK